MGRLAKALDWGGTDRRVRTEQRRRHGRWRCNGHDSRMIALEEKRKERLQCEKDRLRGVCMCVAEEVWGWVAVGWDGLGWVGLDWGWVRLGWVRLGWAGLG